AAVFRSCADRWRSGAREAVARGAGALRVRAPRGPQGAWAVAGLGVALAPAALLLWGLYAAYRLGASLLSSLCFPLRVLDRVLRHLSPPGEQPGPPPAAAGGEQVLALMHQAACDVWLLPADGCYPEVPFPTVVLIEDDPLPAPGSRGGDPDPAEVRLPPHL